MNEIDEIIAEGKESQRLLDNPAYQKAVELVKAKAMEEFCGSTPDDSTKRESAYFLLKAIEQLDLRLRTMTFNGQLEEEKIKRRGRPPKV